MFLYKICAALQAAGISYALVGGCAVALHGAIRGTVDVDIAIKWDLKNLKKLEETLIAFGLVSRIPVTAENIFAFREEYIQNRHLIAWNFYNPRNAAHQLDIIITYDLNKKHINTIKTTYGPIKVLSRKELIVMKRQSGRPQDLEDARTLEEL